jgi:hypothetical protein
VAENPPVVGHVEPIEALHIVASPVALRVLAGKRFLVVNRLKVRTQILG